MTSTIDSTLNGDLTTTGQNVQKAELKQQFDAAVTDIEALQAGTGLADEAVTNAKLAHMTADTVKGRANGAGTGDATDLTATQVRTILNVESGADVTDATNVNAAGATMNTDTDVSSTSWVLDEDDLTTNSATKLATQQSLKAYINNATAGLVIRPKFTWSSITVMTISAGAYHHAGTKEQVVYWDSLLTYTPSSVGVSEDTYIYLDDSAIVTADTNLITVSELTNNNTAPTWNEAKHGWYNGSDRCIYAFLSDGSNQLVEWFHSGNYVGFAEVQTDLAATDIDTTWTAQILSGPAFATRFYVGAFVTVAAGKFYWRTTGQTATSTHPLTADAAAELVNTEVITNSSQSIDISEAVSDTAKITVQTHGWFLPEGM